MEGAPMFVHAPDGQYLICPQDQLSDGPLGTASSRPGLIVGEDQLVVITLNEDDDERVDLDVEYLSAEGRPDLTSMGEQWGGQAVECAFAASQPMWVMTTEGDAVCELTPRGGRFGLALLARRISESVLDDYAPPEQHRLVCWPLDER